MQNITVLCASSKHFWPLMELTAYNRTAYCLKHNYNLSLRLHRDPKWPEDQFFIEREIYMLQELTKSEWLLFMGVDTCFTNMNIKVLDLVADDIIKPDIVYADTKPGTSGAPGINNDVLLLHNTPETICFLETVISLKDKFDNDQNAMKWLLEPEQMRKSGLKAKPVAQKLMNSQPQWKYGWHPTLKVNGIWDGQWEQGDYILHVPGLPLHERIEIIKSVLGFVV